MPRRIESLPRHDEMGGVTRAIEALSIASALLLLGANLFRLASQPEIRSWRLAAVVAAGAILADFGSGVVHWTADTWGNEELPLIGRRLIRPFRVHHVNPRDFLRRNFVDCNGDVALITCPIFVLAWLLSGASETHPLASAFLVALAATGLPTNQVHQWAHQASPPRVVAWLQRAGLILSRAQHARHHTRPFVANYCIATGWCNPALAALGFFPALERAIRLLTGAEPRKDERALDDGATA